MSDSLKPDATWRDREKGKPPTLLEVADSANELMPPQEAAVQESQLNRFTREREELNRIVLDDANLEIKRFFSLDGQVYREGALPAKTKEMLGLVASLVLRCDDCINYHLIRCREEGVSDAELREVCAVGLIVGGSITIPHLRRAMRAWKEAAPTP